MNDNSPEIVPKSELVAATNRMNSATFKPEVSNPLDSATSPVFAPEGMNPEEVSNPPRTRVEKELGRLASSSFSLSTGTDNEK